VPEADTIGLFGHHTRGLPAMNDDEFRNFAQDCMGELQARQEKIAELAVFDHEVDLARGVATYSANGTLFIEADVVPIGSRGQKSSTWLWAWANPSIGGDLGASAGTLRDLASTTGRQEFAADTAVPATEQQAWEYAAIACRHLDGVGVVRFDANDSDWFFVVRALTHHRPEAEIVAHAEFAVGRSLRNAQGPALLNVMRKRFATLHVDLIDADLRGAPQPWAHDLHAQILFDQGRVQASALHELHPNDVFDLGLLASHQLHDLSGANLSSARLDGAVLRGTTLRGASLEGASLVDADLSGADLREASLRSAFLDGANLAGADLSGADVSGAELSRTLLAKVDLSKVNGLDEVSHFGPSEISMSTLIASNFEIDPGFMRKAGVSRGLIEDLMRGKRFAGSYETCFLSYSSKDGEFASQLYSSLTGAGVRVFWDHFDVFPGERLEDQIAEAIREHRRLLVVLSQHSMASEWVVREIELAWLRRRESLLPVRLCPIEDVKQWAATRESLPDLASIFPIQDFSDWRDPKSYDHAMTMVLTALAGGVDLGHTSPFDEPPEAKAARRADDGS
jgi:uncharacterized protein YjbI with pentapeptide repeats